MPPKSPQLPFLHAEQAERARRALAECERALGEGRQSEREAVREAAAWKAAHDGLREKHEGLVEKHERLSLVMQVGGKRVGTPDTSTGQLGI